VDCEWRLLVRRTDLVRQAANRYSLRTNEQAGTFLSGVWTTGTCNVTVSTFQSIHRAITRPKKNFVPPMGQSVRDLIRRTQAFCVDECHAQPADSFYFVSMALENARYRIGMSGTPVDKSDHQNLRTMGATGPIIYKISEDLLVRRGILAKCVTRMIPCDQWSPHTANWRQVYRDLVVLSKLRNSLVVRIVEQAAKPCLCFVEELAQARELTVLLKEKKITVELAYGQHSQMRRMSTLGRLGRGDFSVLICTVIFQEGIDEPRIRSVVNAAGKSKAVGAIQRRGRGMRIHEGKTHFELWDIDDRGQRWLEKHAKLRRQAYESRGDIVSFELFKK